GRAARRARNGGSAPPFVQRRAHRDPVFQHRGARTDSRVPQHRDPLTGRTVEREWAESLHHHRAPWRSAPDSAFDLGVSGEAFRFVGGIGGARHGRNHRGGAELVGLRSEGASSRSRERLSAGGYYQNERSGSAAGGSGEEGWTDSRTPGGRSGRIRELSWT